MRLIINIIIFLVIIGLVYVLISNIQEPIKFKAEKEKRERAVIDKLMTIRKTQVAHRDITGSFAGDFDSLSHVLKTGKFMIVSVQGDPDADEEVTFDTTYSSAIDSMNNLGISLDSLRYVPYGKGATFSIEADTMTYQQTLVNVVQVGVSRKAFMGEWADPRFSMYDNTYDPNKVIKFGDLSKPNTSGNWER